MSQTQINHEHPLRIHSIKVQGTLFAVQNGAAATNRGRADMWRSTIFFYLRLIKVICASDLSMTHFAFNYFFLNKRLKSFCLSPITTRAFSCSRTLHCSRGMASAITNRANLFAFIALNFKRLKSSTFSNAIAGAHGVLLCAVLHENKTLSLTEQHLRCTKMENEKVSIFFFASALNLPFYSAGDICSVQVLTVSCTL